MNLAPATILIAVILALVLVELLVIRERTSNGRQSERLRVPVQSQERLPKGRRFFDSAARWTEDAQSQNSQKENTRL